MKEDYDYLVRQNERLWDAFNRMRDRYNKLRKEKHLIKIDKEKIYKVL